MDNSTTREISTIEGEFLKVITFNIHILDALKQVLTDISFQLPTKEASNALQTAKLLTWCGESSNKDAIKGYDQYFTELFNLWTSTPTTNKVVREQIWIRFSQFVSSSHYVMVWTSLYNTAGIQRCSILSFDLTYSMF